MIFQKMVWLSLAFIACAPSHQGQSRVAGSGASQRARPADQKSFLNALYQNEPKIAAYFSAMFYLQICDDKLNQVANGSDGNGSEELKRMAKRVVTRSLGAPGLVAGFGSWFEFSKYVESVLNKGKTFSIPSENWDDAFYGEYIISKKTLAENLNALLNDSQSTNEEVKKKATDEKTRLIRSANEFLSYVKKDLSSPSTELGYFYLIKRLQLGLQINPD